MITATFNPLLLTLSTSAFIFSNSRSFSAVISFSSPPPPPSEFPFPFPFPPRDRDVLRRPQHKTPQANDEVISAADRKKEARWALDDLSDLIMLVNIVSEIAPGSECGWITGVVAVVVGEADSATLIDRGYIRLKHGLCPVWSNK
jgi:hypothetical protein